MNKTHYSILIIGGGTAGIDVAARLRAKASKFDIAVIDPSEKHYYQPLWTLVGGGVTKKEVTEKREADLIPRGVTWIRDAVVAFEPAENRVRLRSGPLLGYDYLVVCPGIQVNWKDIKGLKETMGRNGVCSNYDFNTVDSTWQAIRSLRQGTAIFTMPATPIKCAGAPQKIMYLAEDHFRRTGVRDEIRVVYASATPAIFGVAKYRKALEKVIADRGMQTCFRHNLIEVRGDSREAIFTQLDTKEEVVMKFDLLHVTPPMSAPDFIRESPLADKDGWVEVDKYNLQHPRFANIFALGDASSLPTSRTGAAIRKEAPVLVENLLAHRAGQPLKGKYNGYSSCPLVTGYGKLILAEFDYDGNPAETFPFDQSKERYSMWLLKRWALPVLYWQGMLKGRA
jgi:sulfide:quinone oxidoreductase